MKVRVALEAPVMPSKVIIADTNYAEQQSQKVGVAAEATVVPKQAGLAKQLLGYTHLAPMLQCVIYHYAYRQNNNNHYEDMTMIMRMIVIMIAIIVIAFHIVTDVGH